MQECARSNLVVGCGPKNASVNIFDVVLMLEGRPQKCGATSEIEMADISVGTMMQKKEKIILRVPPGMLVTINKHYEHKQASLVLVL